MNRYRAVGSQTYSTFERILNDNAEAMKNQYGYYPEVQFQRTASGYWSALLSCSQLDREDEN